MRASRASIGGAVAISAALLLAPVLVASPALAAPSGGVVVYDAAPETRSGPLSSVAYYSNKYAELGQRVTLGGTLRDLNRIEVEMHSWACEVGQYNSTENPCVTTTPGSGFTHPITMSLYDASDLSVLATVTENVFVPYRPSSDPANCPEPQRFVDAVTGLCENGFPFIAEFDFSVLDFTMPDQFVVGVALNSRGAGYDPLPAPPGYGTPEPYNLLNVAIGGDVPATVGTAEDAFYLASGSAPELAGPSAWGAETYALKLTIFAHEAAAIAPTAPSPTSPELAETGVNVDAAVLAAPVLLLLGGVSLLLIAARRKSDA